MSQIAVNYGRCCASDPRSVGGRRVSEGVREASCLHGSLVNRPFGKRSVGDNASAGVYSKIVARRHVSAAVMPESGSAENTSRLAMVTPDQGGAMRFVGLKRG